MDKFGAVITGDIINSTKYSIETRIDIRSQLEKVSKELLKKPIFSKIIPLPIDIFQGDSWQILVHNYRKSLRVGLFIRAQLKAFMGSENVDTRFSIGIGVVNPSSKRVSLGDGDAFILSGSALTFINNKRSQNLILSVSESIKISSSDLTALNTILPLLDFISSKWTSKQAQAVAGSLCGLSSAQIASQWMGNKIERQVVSGHLQKAGWNAIEESVNFFENIFIN